MMPLALVRSALTERMARDHPNLDWQGHICRSHLNEYRTLHVQEILRQEKGELTTLDAAVVESLERNETLAADIERQWRSEASFGQRCADTVAAFGGSWVFIFAFLAVMAGVDQAHSSGAGAFDPFPFILLNLCLSCLAAMQAPIIMMSQNRQEARDRLRSENDYRVNLKAELEIRHLHEKVDHLLSRQWERLAEIQQIQIDIMRDIGRRQEGI
jgi:uncharacterized membrane protein